MAQWACALEAVRTASVFLTPWWLCAQVGQQKKERHTSLWDSTTVSSGGACSHHYEQGMSLHTFPISLQPPSSTRASMRSWSTESNAAETYSISLQEVCPPAIRSRSATKAASFNVLAWLQTEPLCHSRNTVSSKPPSGQRVSAEAIQPSAIQMFLRKSSQQAKPRETNLKNKNQEINAVLFTVSLR